LILVLGANHVIFHEGFVARSTSTAQLTVDLSDIAQAGTVPKNAPLVASPGGTVSIPVAFLAIRVPTDTLLSLRRTRD
jgi:hypothetical protein